MAKQRTSHPENRRDVYKFWLGFFEKATLVLVTVVIIPRFTGQLNYSIEVSIWSTTIFLVLLAVMIYLSFRLWYMPKDEKKQREKKS
jgi:hypothetical protein